MFTDKDSLAQVVSMTALRPICNIKDNDLEEGMDIEEDENEVENVEEDLSLRRTFIHIEVQGEDWDARLKTCIKNMRDRSNIAEKPEKMKKSYISHQHRQFRSKYY
jgi:hypothetical protein